MSGVIEKAIGGNERTFASVAIKAMKTSIRVLIDEPNLPK